MILTGNALEKLRELPDESVDCVITSPPYYLLREYGNAEAVWDAEPDCEHEWGEEEKAKVRGDFSKALVGNNKKGLDPQVKLLGRFCVKCGAWKGELGHEPSPELYIKHLGDIFDQVKRVLKKTGNCFIVIGDTYAGGGGTTGGYTQSWEKNADHRPKNRLSQKIVGTQSWIKRKQLLLIPYRLAIELQMRGWIIRDLIIWAKKVAVVNKEGDVVEQIGNGLPESVKDRLTKAYEVIIHAVKSEKYYFNKPRTSMKPQSVERLMRGVSENHKYAKLQYGGGRLNKPRPNIKKLTGVEFDGTSYVGNVLQMNTEPFPDAHFAVFPTKLVRFLIKAGCPEGGIVLDPFMGAGTVALVAQELGRKWIGVEINPNYAKIAQERLKEVGTKILL